VASSEQTIRYNTSRLTQTQMTGTSHGSSPPVPATAEVDSFANPEEIDYESLPTTSVRVQLLAGALAGIAEHTIVYPIDAIKVKSHRDELTVDSNAGYETDTGGGLYRDYSCCIKDSIDGGSVGNVERDYKCGFRSR
jgi:hypothetical protein